MADTFSLQNMNKTAFYSEILLNFTQRYSFFSLQITFQKCTFAFETANLQTPRGKKGDTYDSYYGSELATEVPQKGALPSKSIGGVPGGKSWSNHQ